jgi:prepilin-type processing-associated H-X9-DG protein
VELLVVITIIGMLVALLIPAVQAARETARAGQCASQLGELAKATIAYETSKGSFPSYVQFVKRGQNRWATVAWDSNIQKIGVVTASQPETPFSWASMLLRNIERQDIWDQIVDVNLTPQIPAVDVFICPSDSDALAIAGRPTLSYNANTGAWDRDDRDFLYPPNRGDAGPNGVMFNHAAYELQGAKAPVTRLSGINDGANMTILYSENKDKTYEPENPSGMPLMSWLAGNVQEAPDSAEQQFGLVWVVNPNPIPGNKIDDQEAINRNADDLVIFDQPVPRFARPSSNHNSGVNVAFCDAHVSFVRDDIDYTVYQRLLTTNGAKCEDPVRHRGPKTFDLPDDDPIKVFRMAPPLSESDFH